MTYKQLQVFVALVEENSFSAAAQKLEVTQPAVSWQLKSLENELDVTLLERGTRGFTLTEAGHALYQNALTIVNQFALLSDHMAHFQESEPLRIQVGCSAIPGDYVLPKLILPFLQAHPNLFVKVAIDNSTVIIDKVLKGELSLGIVDIHPKESALNAQLIMKDGLIPIASPSLGIPEDVSLKDLLLGQTVIAHVDGHRIHRLAQGLFDSQNIPYTDARIPFETGSVQASITAVIHGLGIAWVPKSAVTSALQTGSLVTFPCAEPIMIGYYLIHQDSRRLSPVESHLKELLTGKGAEKN